MRRIRRPRGIHHKCGRLGATLFLATMPPMALLRANAARAHPRCTAARSTYGCYSRSRALSYSHARTTVRRGDPLPEDPTPAMWQRVAQLVAGTTATGTLAYFVFLADFGETEHCFSPVRMPT